ncbi:IucC family-domain-containing protein, partial [Blastocladiella britannica]
MTVPSPTVLSAAATAKGSSAMIMAQFAVASRLIAALVSEQLLPAHCHPSNSQSVLIQLKSGSTIVIQTRHAVPHDPHTRAVLALDRDDLTPCSGMVPLDPVAIWDLVRGQLPGGPRIMDTVRDQLANSVSVLATLTIAALARPTPELEGASPEDWELAIVEGHPTHPTGRARATAKPLPEYDAVRDLRATVLPRIYFALVPRTELRLCGTWADEVHPHLVARLGLEDDATGTIPVPVHELQVPWVRATLPHVPIVALDDDRGNDTATALSSTRTLSPHDTTLFPRPMSHVKLSIAMIIGSGMRTISKYSVHNASILSRMAAAMDMGPHLATFPEYASVGLLDPATDKYLACVLRDTAAVQVPGERLVVCGALTERD